MASVPAIPASGVGGTPPIVGGAHHNQAGVAPRSRPAIAVELHRQRIAFATGGHGALPDAPRAAPRREVPRRPSCLGHERGGVGAPLPRPLSMVVFTLVAGTYFPALTLMVLGRMASALGIFRVRMPFSSVASTLSACTSLGRVMLREKAL